MIGQKGDILAGSLTLTANEPARVRMFPLLYDVTKLHLTAPMDFFQMFVFPSHVKEMSVHWGQTKRDNQTD